MSDKLHLPPTTDLPRALAELLQQVPRGRVTTYGELARALGDKSAARWVGTWMLDHPHDASCPCHRVVRGTGDVGLYIGGEPDDKLARLQSEGVPVQEGRVDVTSPFTDLVSTAPLRALSEFQVAVPRHLNLSPLERPPQRVAGIDVAYPAPGLGIVACGVVDASSLQTEWEQTLELPVTFPYISGYLAFRELPLMLEAWQAACEAGHGADVVFIDGNGYLHPRRAGIASCFGLLADVPTIGIGKSLLCGRVDLNDMTAADRRAVIHNDELIGVAVKSQDFSKPVFCSPGHRIDFDGAVELTRRMMHGHRLPEPVHLADRLSKRAVRERAEEGT